MEQRLQLLKQWIEYSSPDPKIIDRLHQFGWDYEAAPFEMKAAHIHNILSRYLKDELSKEEVHEWADFIEGREDVDYEKFRDIIFDLANAEINVELNPQLAEKIIRELNMNL